jgi:WD repeat and SOF domain-containing protein 1
MQAQAAARRTGTNTGPAAPIPSVMDEDEDEDINDKTDLDWSTVIKRTFEGYIRGERPNMYGESIEWGMA